MLWYNDYLRAATRECTPMIQSVTIGDMERWYSNIMAAECRRDTDSFRNAVYEKVNADIEKEIATGRQGDNWESSL